MSRSLQVTSAVSVVSIAWFNWCGVSVTKRLSGAARCTIDACRTIFIWRAPPPRSAARRRLPSPALGSVPPPASPRAAQRAAARLSPRLCALRTPCE